MTEYRAFYGPVDLGERPRYGVSDDQWETFCLYVRGTETMAEIGTSLGVSKSAVSQTIQKAHRRLVGQGRSSAPNAYTRARNHHRANGEGMI